MPKQTVRPEVEKKQEQKNKFEFRLAIINLVLTAIIGIGVAFVLNFINNKLTKDIQESEKQLAIELQERDEKHALDLKIREEEFSRAMEMTQEAFAKSLESRQEEFQKEMIRVQKEIEDQANQSHLRFSMVCFNLGMMCSNVVFISNDGPATAKNVRVVVYMDQVNEIWLADLQDVNNFKLSIDPTELPINIEQIQVSPLFGYSSRVKGNNAFEFTLPSLPPEGWFRIYISPSSDLVYDIKQVSRILEVDTSLSNDVWTDPYRNFSIDEEYSLVIFTSTATCENCVETENNYYNFPVSGSIDTSLTKIEQNNLNNEGLNKYYLSVKYMVPKGYEGVLDTSDLKLTLETSSQYYGFHFRRDYSSK